MFLTDEKLSELLLAAKLVDQKILDEAKDEATRTKRSLENVLVESGKVPDEAIGEMVAKSLNVPFVSLAKVTIPEQYFRILPEQIARKQRALVFERNQDTVKVAMANPTRDDLVNMIAKKTGQKVQVYLATKRDVEKALSVFKRDLQKSVDILLKYDSGRITKIKVDDPPVAKVVEVLIGTAYDERASDIHIEPQENEAVVRFRIDGVLHEVLRINKLLADRIVTRIKVLSNLRTDEHLSAQDGKMKVLVEDERVDIRVSIVPIVDGEKVVMRLLSAKARQFTLGDLGMNEKDLAKVSRAYTKSYGMILSTGPTGSGKTTSIYAMMRVLNSPEKNITSVEDPVEYRISGANQIQVNVKTNLTFANGLRSILRQDPNIIFVGEIRDNETAGIAVNAALTGHLVLSTLHTNDAATTLPRLTDMKVEPFLVASTVTVIIAQRLVRRVCPACKTEIEIDHDELSKAFSPTLVKKVLGRGVKAAGYKGTGCKVCRGSGYTGRIGLFEVLEITPALRNLIVNKADSDEILKKAIEEGMTTMMEDGLVKVFQGSTTIDEVLRVTKSEFL